MLFVVVVVVDVVVEVDEDVEQALELLVDLEASLCRCSSTVDADFSADFNGNDVPVAWLSGAEDCDAAADGGGGGGEGPLHESERDVNERLSKARRNEDVDRRCNREKLVRLIDLRLPFC